ncbi:MAG: outer membrane protein assembly factor BamA [Treponema sp.]|nr:outer membrane protein assembly factor BamA [Treponema sp.]
MTRSIFAVFLLLLTVFCFAQTESPPPDWYQGKPIRDIRFEGLVHIKRSEMEGTIESYRGKLFTYELFQELQGRLYTLEYFELITPTAIPADQGGNEVILLFKVVERPTISKITFVGNSGVKRRDLTDAISSKVNDVANNMLISADESAIRNKYMEKGFPDIQIRSEMRPARNDTIELVFFITEGTKVVVTQVFFEGNTLFSDSTLRGQLSMKAKGLGPGRSGAYQDVKLIADRDAIGLYYHSKGYLDAEVTDVVQEVVRDAKGNNNMTITYRLYEGRIYTFSGFSFEGNEIFTDEQLEKLVRSEIGKTANALTMEADFQRIVNLYLENGYIYNDLRRDENRDLEEGTVAFNVSIIERGRAHIENIIIRGNKKTKDYVILREIPLEPGDIYSSNKVIAGFRNLMNLQFFSSIFPEPVPGSEDGLMDLIINVEEGHTTDIQFGLTFSGSSDPDDFPISGLLSITDRNFLGYGNQARAEINFSTSQQSLALSYSQRWLREIPLSWMVDMTISHAKRFTPMNNGPGPLFHGDEDDAFPDGYWSRDEYWYDNKLPPREYLMEYQQWFFSVGLSATYRWGTKFGILGTGGGIRTGFINNSYDDMLRPFDPVIRERNDEWTPVNSFWTIAYLDDRDLFYDPSKGYYTSQRFSFHGFFPIELEHYIRSDTKAEIFFTLFDFPTSEKWSFKGVLMLHSGLSFIFPQFGLEKPIIEDVSKLFIDGMFIGRGWYDARMSRGFALWENTMELRIPLVPGFLAFDIFLDAVAAAADTGYTPNQKALDFFGSMKEDNWRFSYGAGLRFTLAQFPFRFLFAKRFIIQDGQLKRMPGSLFKSSGDPDSGVDFVISFAIPTN